MRSKYKSSEGSGIIEFDDGATLGTVYEMLRNETGINSFSIKIGPPMAMKTLDTRQMDVLARSLGLNNETLTIVSEDPKVEPATMAASPGRMPQQTASHTPEKSSAADIDEIYVPWPARDGTLLLRVMPSDNSCLFTAFGGALPQQIPPPKLRQMMAEYIQQHPAVYTEAVLGAPAEQYCRNILDPDRWGGGIELSILSSIFDIRICTFDIQTQSLIAFGENKADICVLAYSGIHYDRVAFSYSEFPHTSPQLPPEMDRTTWPIYDEEIITKAKLLVSKLHSAHYYTDMDGLVLKCDVAGCSWIGTGDTDGRKHAEETGHTELSEVQGMDGDHVLRKCSEVGCDFMGQGDKSARQHTSDTGHKEYHMIPDQ